MTVIALVGPTAAGKTDLAIGLATRIGGEIVSVDSMQVYRGMDIGTAKPDKATRAAIPHHLIDLAAPSHDYTVSEFQEAGRAVLAGLAAREVPAVITGGTGLYLRALIDPLVFPPTDAELRRELEGREHDELVGRLVAADGDAADHVDLSNPRRVARAVEVLELTGATPSKRARSPESAAVRRYEPTTPFLGVGLDPGAALRERIVDRFDRMLSGGLLDEVTRLEPTMGRAARQAVGYKELIPVVTSGVSLEEARAAAINATAALAKRQRTFFRRDPRITWLDPQLAAGALVDEVCEKMEAPAAKE